MLDDNPDEFNPRHQGFTSSISNTQGEVITVYNHILICLYIIVAPSIEGQK